MLGFQADRDVESYRDAPLLSAGGCCGRLIQTITNLSCTIKFRSFVEGLREFSGAVPSKCFGSKEVIQESVFVIGIRLAQGAKCFCPEGLLGVIPRGWPPCFFQATVPYAFFFFSCRRS